MAKHVNARGPIHTVYTCPPIGDRRWDWCAYRDPEGDTGRGATEAEAIADLLDKEAEDDHEATP